jgi:predicted aspartyl protease
MYERAQGKDKEHTAEVVEDWKLFQDNMQGTFRTRRYLTNYIETTTLGPLTYLNGARNTLHWQQNRNGLTIPYSGLHERDAISERAFDLVAPDRPEVHVLGESPAFGAYVIEVDPSQGRHEWIFIDKRTGEMTRRERVERGRRYMTTYENFRTFDGDPMATRVHTVDSLGNERDQQLIARTVDPTPDLHDFDPPPNRRTFVEFPAHAGAVRLPARLVNGLFVVRVNIANHGYDFLLDTGAAGIVLDTQLAESLSLERYGSKNGNTVGTYLESTSIVPEMTIGPLRMQRVVTRVVPLPFHAEGSTRIVGLLGFDFFDDLVAHIDYADASVDVMPWEAFAKPSGTQIVPLALDDKTPLARVHIDDGVTARLTIDTGANRTLVFSDFAERAALPYDRLDTTVRFRAVGGIGSGGLGKLRSIDVGTFQLDKPTVEISPDTFGTEDTDGVLGSDVLRALDVWFDFRGTQAFVRRSKARPAEIGRKT